MKVRCQFIQHFFMCGFGGLVFIMIKSWFLKSRATVQEDGEHPKCIMFFHARLIGKSDLDYKFLIHFLFSFGWFHILPWLILRLFTGTILLQSALEVV